MRGAFYKIMFAPGAMDRADRRAAAEGSLSLEERQEPVPLSDSGFDGQNRAALKDFGLFQSLSGNGTEVQFISELLGQNQSFAGDNSANREFRVSFGRERDFGGAAV